MLHLPSSKADSSNYDRGGLFRSSLRLIGKMCRCSDLSSALGSNLTGLIGTTACEDNSLIASGDSHLGVVTASLIAGLMSSYDDAGERKLVNCNLRAGEPVLPFLGLPLQG